MSDVDIENSVDKIMSEMLPATKLALMAIPGAKELARDAVRVGYCAGQKDAYGTLIPELEKLT